MEYDNYIVFLLGCDEFDVCQKIRRMCGEWGADSLYNDCVYIAKKFEEYDREHTNYTQYDNFCAFIFEYKKEINSYLDYGNVFDVKKEI